VNERYVTIEQYLRELIARVVAEVKRERKEKAKL
jgi:hypothetical protein